MGNVSVELGPLLRRDRRVEWRRLSIERTRTTLGCLVGKHDIFSGLTKLALNLYIKVVK